MIRSPKKNVPEEETGSFWISYSDILSSLLIIILLVTVYAIFELMQTKRNVTQSLEEITTAELIRKDVLEEVQENLKAEGIVVEVADNFSVLRIPESTLTFRSNDYRIPIRMQKALQKIGEAILKSLDKENRTSYFDTVFIDPNGWWTLIRFLSIQMATDRENE